MPYTTLATSQTPALIVYLLDVSASMSMPLGEKRRIDVVMNALLTVFRQMAFRSTKGKRIFPRYRIAMFAYSDDVYNVFGGAKTITEVVRMGVPDLSPMKQTDTARGLTSVANFLRAELPSLQNCPAPVICHMTDGIYTGDDPEPVAQRIMGMRVPDGPVLLTNIFVTAVDGLLAITDERQWPGITDQTMLGADQYLNKLRRMSSKIPETYRQVMQEDGYQIQSGAYMLLPAANPALLTLGFQMASATPIR